MFYISAAPAHLSDLMYASGDEWMGLYECHFCAHTALFNASNRLLKALSHYNVLVQRSNYVRKKIFSEQNVGERFKKLRQSSHPRTWLRPGTVLLPFTVSFHRSRTAQSTFLLYPTTFSCHSATVLDNIQPPVLRPCTVICVPLPSV